MKNNERYSLARIPLRWMIRECFNTNSDIIFDADVLKELGLDPKTLYPGYKRPARKIAANKDVTIDDAKPKPSDLRIVFSLLGQLLAIPFKIVFSIVLWPFKHLSLLLYYSPPVKWVVKKLGFSNKKQDENTPATIPARSAVQVPLEVDEEEEELNDATSPEYDQLAISWFWWILEFLPMRHRSQKSSRQDQFVRYVTRSLILSFLLADLICDFRMNKGEGRMIYGDARKGGLLVHRSVKTRLEVLDAHGDSVYKPRAWFKQHVGGRKVKGPATWNIENPSRDQWQWVD